MKNSSFKKEQPNTATNQTNHFTKREKQFKTATMYFLSAMAGIMIGYAWAFYHYRVLVLQ